jgi:predicted RNase H-like HicB family nuclease
MDYIAYLHKESKSDFGVSFPDFPGCITAGKTLEEARTMAIEVLQFHIEGMLEDGLEIPTPSSLDQLAGDPDMKGAVAVLIPFTPSEKTIRVNITAREGQIQRIDRLASLAGLSRSAYMVETALQGLAKRRKPQNAA